MGRLSHAHCPTAICRPPFTDAFINLKILVEFIIKVYVPAWF